MEGTIELVHITLLHSLALPNQYLEQEEATEAIVTDEGKETEVREARSGGNGEFDHHVIGTTIEGAGEDEMEGNENKDVQEEEERPRDH